MDKKNNFSIKKHYEYRQRRKQVLQNSPISFRPTSEVLSKLKSKQLCRVEFNKTKFINEAIAFYLMDPVSLLDMLSLRYPQVWRRINTRNGQFITQKLKKENLKDAGLLE